MDKKEEVSLKRLKERLKQLCNSQNSHWWYNSDAVEAEKIYKKIRELEERRGTNG